MYFFCIFSTNSNIALCIVIKFFVCALGAVYFGLDPAVVTRRRSMMTYGVEVLNRFDADRHPSSKLIHRGGRDWCTGVFDVFVKADQVI